MLANHVSRKGLVSRIQTTSKTLTKNPNLKKWAKDLNKHFYKEYILMANNHIKRCSTALLGKCK